MLSGVHIGDLAAGYPGLSVGHAEGAGQRGSAAVLHSRLVPELAPERPSGGHSPVDALPGHPLHTGDALLPRAQRQGRGSRQQPAVATGSSRRHKARAQGKRTLQVIAIVRVCFGGESSGALTEMNSFVLMKFLFYIIIVEVKIFFY